MSELDSTSQRRRLGVAPGMRVALDAAPEGWSFAEPIDGFAEPVGCTKVAALDEDWSALKFVWRLNRRNGG